VLAETLKLCADLRRKARKLSFLPLQLAIGAGSLNDDERIRLVKRIANALADDAISARQATLLTRQLNSKKGR
jgi:hypothetical protein